VRQWNQSPDNGGVSENMSTSLSHYVKASSASFTLNPGSRPVSFKMLRMTASGSLYGAIDVFAKQVHPKAINGVIPQYRVIGALRLTPTTPHPGLKVGNVIVAGKGNGRVLQLPVRNTGNTLDLVTGSVTLSGPASRTNTVATPAPPNSSPVGVLPTKVVKLKAGSLSGLKGGNYTATFHLSQGTKKYTARRGFKL
jgi:hypothetical protein